MENKTLKQKSYRCIKCQFEYDLPQDSYERYITKVTCPYCQGKMELVRT